MSWSRSTGRDNKAPRKTRLGRVVTSSTKGKGKKSVSQLAREELVGKNSAKSRQKQYKILPAGGHILNSIQIPTQGYAEKTDQW